MTKQAHGIPPGDGLREGQAFARGGTATGDTPVLSHVKVSIVTVVFNGAAELEKTIQSVLGQSYSNMEYIVIDGGSTDGTLEILERYRNSIDVLVSEGDRGIYDAMNKGLALASGDWINFMNCGDYFFDEFVVEHIVPDLCSDSALVAGGYTMFSDNGCVEFNAEALRFAKMPACHQSIFFNSGIAKRTPYDINYRVGADYDVVCRMAHGDEAAKIRLSSVMVVKMNAVGFASANFARWMSDYRAVIKKYYGPLRANIWTLKVLAARHLPMVMKLKQRCFKKLSS